MEASNGELAPTRMSWSSYCPIRFLSLINIIVSLVQNCSLRINDGISQLKVQVRLRTGFVDRIRSSSTINTIERRMRALGDISNPPLVGSRTTPRGKTYGTRVKKNRSRSS